MRAAIYARYSTELQRDASIEDQVRLCTSRIDTERWTPAGVYTDHAMSGSIRMRPGYQKLLEDARAGAFDIVVSEALDRLSRDQEDVAGLFKHLSFSGIKLFTIAEGEIAELQVGFKGTMNALFLKDLRQKVRRGLEGRVRKGKSGGGLSYGYQVVRELDVRGELVRGGRRIDESQAAIVRRIFEAFATGKSPRAIAKELNLAAIPGPGGRPWSDTMIRGHRTRGTGILHNELLGGRIVWNRQRFVKDPVTGKRLPRLNPEKDWVVHEAPELRIVEPELWKRVRARLDRISNSAPVARARASQFWKRRRPKHLLTGLLICGGCGATYATAGRHYVACSAARRQGICENRKGIPRHVLEELVIDALRHHLLQPAYVAEFIRAFHVETNRQQNDFQATIALQQRELFEITRKLDGLIEAIADGLRAGGLQAKLDELELKKTTLTRELAAKPERAPLLHPRLADVYREKVARLHGALSQPADRAEALEILRSLIDKIVVRPVDDRFELELVGEIANMVALVPGAEGARNEPYRSSVKVVAGEGFEPPTLGL
jgi:site-specific DNA recombinase